MEDPPNHLPANVARLRSARGWSQRELAQRCGLNVATVGKAERGGSVWTSTVLALGRGLGVNPGVLLAEPVDL